MSKPEWFDKAKEESRSFTRLEEGGHRCVIKEIKPTKTKDLTKDMWIIFYDTADDDRQPHFYTDDYIKQTGDKTWRGKTWWIVDAKVSSKNKDGTDSFYGQANLARFITAIEDSNPMFETDWNNDYMSQPFLEQFKGKLIGIVFGLERYADPIDKTLRASIKARYFRNIDKVEEAKIPEAKENIRVIQVYLGDQQTAAVVRGKISKKKLEAV